MSIAIMIPTKNEEANLPFALASVCPWADQVFVLELRILGYEFPHIETAEYDSNWLVVAGNVTHSTKGSWQFTHCT